jgi:hypothetical protein
MIRRIVHKGGHTVYDPLHEIDLIYLSDIEVVATVGRRHSSLEINTWKVSVDGQRVDLKKSAAIANIGAYHAVTYLPPDCLLTASHSGRSAVEFVVWEISPDGERIKIHDSPTPLPGFRGGHIPDYNVLYSSCDGHVRRPLSRSQSLLF